MFKLCFVLVIVGMAATLSEAQSISSPFPLPPKNPFLAHHLTRTGFYNRNSYDNNYQQNFFLRSFLPPVRYAGPDGYARIISHHKDARPYGVYQYVYETENGIRGQERGIPKQLKFGEPSSNVEGSYTYTSPEGLQVLVDYTADEDGFHPQLSYGGNGAQRFINSPEPASTIINNNRRN